MSRPVSITNEQILKAAREVFLEKGVSASTAEVARRAGISEGSLFNRFATKEELFFAAVGVPKIPPWFATMDRLSGTGDLKENLIELYVEIIEHFRQILPRITMAWASRLPPPHHFLDMDEPPPVRIQKKLADFFAKEIELGRVRACEPQLLAAAYLGGMHHIAMVEMIGRKEPRPARYYAEQMMDFLWRAYAPLAAESKP